MDWDIPVDGKKVDAPGTVAECIDMESALPVFIWSNADTGRILPSSTKMFIVAVAVEVAVTGGVGGVTGCVIGGTDDVMTFAVDDVIDVDGAPSNSSICGLFFLARDVFGDSSTSVGATFEVGLWRRSCTFFSLLIQLATCSLSCVASVPTALSITPQPLVIVSLSHRSTTRLLRDTIDERLEPVGVDVDLSDLLM